MFTSVITTLLATSDLLMNLAATSDPDCSSVHRRTTANRPLVKHISGVKSSTCVDIYTDELYFSTAVLSIETKLVELGVWNQATEAGDTFTRCYLPTLED
jgi:hypothetical protein